MHQGLFARLLMGGLWVGAASAQPSCPAVVSQLKAAEEAARPALLNAGVAACCAQAQGPSGPFFCGLVQHDLGRFEQAVGQYQLYLSRPDSRRGAQGRRTDAGSWLAHASQRKFRDGTAPPVIKAIAPPSKAPVPPPPVPSEFALTVRCTPADAQIEVDSKPHGMCSTGSITLPPGAHDVQVKAPGFVSGARSIQLKKSMTITMALEALPTPESSVAPWILGGVGVAALGVGGWFHAENLSNFDSLKSTRERGIEGRALADTVDSDRLTAIGGYVVGSVLLTAAVTWIFWPDGAEQ
ncbi:MAG: hypothetical protein ACI9U2_001515 [Bradymonadia bacterium]|jgi:hypothetical protein